MLIGGGEEDQTKSCAILVRGTMISHYRIVERIGAGGMGEVYLAEDTELKRKVALKFIPQQFLSDSDAKARFKREAQATAVLNHPNIVTIHEVGEFQGRPFFAMEYIEGQALRDMIKCGDLSISRVVDLAVQICEGLSKAHQSGITHRDIKPSNIIVDADGRPKILDFGLAAVRGAEKLTHTGSTLGTVGYMSPEQIRGKKTDARSDLFSLGVVLYEMITGRSPFKGDNEAAILHAITHETPEPLARFCADVPEELQRIVTKLLEKDPGMRCQTAADLGSDLKKLRKQLESPAAESIVARIRPQPSIAVLPFTNLSADKEQDYFCDGMAEEIINALTQLEGLRVVARTSAFSFRGKEQDIREIGRKLNVVTVLEGSVRKAGNRLRITAQLVNVADGYHLWSERYDREMEDVFAIQDGISMAVVEKLKLQLQKSEDARVFRRGTNDLDAYTSYLKGRFLFNQRTVPALKESIGHYQQAVDKDPRFALAYAGLADSYAVLGTWRALDRVTAFEKARTVAMQAIEIDDSLVEAHVSLATIRLFGDWDWDGAEREYRLALTQNPHHAEAHHMYAHLLEISGRFDSAVSEINRALELEPVSPGVNSCAVEVLFYARRYQEAIAQCRKALEVAPHFLGLYGWLGMAYVQNGETERGIETLKKGLESLGDDPKLHAFLGYAFAVSHRAEDANKSLGQVLTLAERRHVDPYFVAWIHAGLEDRASTFKWLNKACDERSEWVAWLKVDPLLDNLHADPRYHDLLERMRLD